MEKKNFVFSTLTTPVSFVEYGPKREGSFPEVVRRVTIMGGANVPAKTLITPKGVVTAVSDEEAGFLATNKQFAGMSAKGFVVLARNKDDLDRALLDMTPKDGCAPKVPEDFRKPVRVGHG